MILKKAIKSILLSTAILLSGCDFFKSENSIKDIVSKNSAIDTISDKIKQNQRIPKSFRRKPTKKEKDEIERLRVESQKRYNDEMDEQDKFSKVLENIGKATEVEKINLAAESHKRYASYQDARKANETAERNLWDSVANLEYDPSWLLIKQRPFKETLPGSTLKRDHS
ncbi:MAG: hypothetical protein EU981_01970 [Candidatus Liberibacter ctenarytainae]|uniref:Lipoprotein n=1 Tax=Candidatus Liberibacter ctenarytainae TaxID=2020335 RepID=A0A937AQ27_9HYPH|nr:hypothetical protein [Candidatus Liberibacter ctenarytainae]